MGPNFAHRVLRLEASASTCKGFALGHGAPGQYRSALCERLTYLADKSGSRGTSGGRAFSGWATLTFTRGSWAAAGVR